MNIRLPLEEVVWPLEHAEPPLMNDIETDVVIIGAGIAGLSAAQSFAERRKRVVVLEKYHCAADASGKSTGFITANSELGLSHFVSVYGDDQAHRVWQLANSGVAHIQKNINIHKIACDYRKEDALIVANSRGGLKALKKEYNNYQKFGYESSFYNKHEIKNLVHSSHYYGGMRYGDSFAINAHHYCYAMKKVLMAQGVQFYENTPALLLKHYEVKTAHGSVKAEHIIVCTDHCTPELNKLTDKIFQVQTFILMSEPLPEETIKKMLPDKRYLMWDTDMVYQYFRFTGDNRLLIGGNTMWHSYVYKQEHNPPSVYKKLSSYMQKKFPRVPIKYEYMWPGLIGVSKDLMPLIGKDRSNPSIYYVGAVTGLAWGAALGEYAAQHILEGRDDFDRLLSTDRKFLIQGCMQTILGKRITFGLSNLISLLK
jgi:gamma-glutamylputrescine oxidase